MSKKQKKWWQYLLSIPAVLLFDVIVIMMALFMDGAWVNDAPYGHGMPVITMAAGFILAVITIITVIRSIGKVVRSLKRTDENADTLPAKKPTYLPSAVSLVVSTILLYVCGKSEINAFYNNPEHVGFAIPMTTITIGAILLIVNLIVILINHKVNKKRRRQ